MPLVYETSPIKRRRSTMAEMEERENKLFSIVDKMKPMTVRQVFYQAEVAGIVEKTETGYDKVQRALVTMRRSGRMPYGWLADSTRLQRKPRTFRDPQAALEETAKFYRKALWADLDQHVEIWLEKDALSGVIYPVTSRYDVPLMVARGYSSLTFLAEAADDIRDYAADGARTYIYHLGDFDPSGVNAAEKIRDTLNEMAPEADIVFRRLAVTEEQIKRLNLPTRPTKTSDSRAKNFAADSVELDAMSPDFLRDLVTVVLDSHLPKKQLEILKAAEASEKATLLSWAAA